MDNNDKQHDAAFERVDTPELKNSLSWALNEWLDKTAWVQKEIKSFPVSALGKHRADVMREEILRLRAAQADARRYRLLVSLIRYAASNTPHEELPEVERAVVDICGEHVQDIDALVAAVDDVLARFPNAGQA